MLNAFMGSVYEEAVIKGRQALLKCKANQIADYEGKSAEIILANDEGQVDVGKSDDTSRKGQVDIGKLTQEVEKLKVNLSSNERILK
ncbi:5766_t:CDS:2 [Funneliformis mosseae]|uniref:5766_t:CDS:1 n=1 Tax=Funneliformis mosseae TaxID=27381 RepID=A0A9N9H979_FUNMO|nr:5766_t:CDS:2 [Funneliformis mosseae]